MLSSADSLMSTIKFDFNRIDLLQRDFDRNIKISTKLLRKLNDFGSVDDMFATTSTPTAETRRGTKRKLEQEKHLRNENQCKKCECRMLRSVDAGRSDGQNVLECMRSSCLASVKLTDLPAGTVVGKELNANQKSIYNSLDRYYPRSLVTSLDPDELGFNPFHDKRIFSLAAGRSIYIDVPGQEKAARLH